MGDIIEIATCFGIFEIDRGGDNAVMDGEGGSNAFDATCTAEEVSSHGYVASVEEMAYIGGT